jgi:hypothetical protein
MTDRIRHVHVGQDVPSGDGLPRDRAEGHRERLGRAGGLAYERDHTSERVLIRLAQRHRDVRLAVCVRAESDLRTERVRDRGVQPDDVGRGGAFDGEAHAYLLVHVRHASLPPSDSRSRLPWRSSCVSAATIKPG